MLQQVDANILDLPREIGGEVVSRIVEVYWNSCALQMAAKFTICIGLTEQGARLATTESASAL